MDTRIAYVDSDDRITRAALSKAERAAVIGIRATHIEQGAPPLVPTTANDTALAIATREADACLIPVKIRRNVGRGVYELWTFKELATGYAEIKK